MQISENSNKLFSLFKEKIVTFKLLHMYLLISIHDWKYEDDFEIQLIYHIQIMKPIII